MDICRKSSNFATQLQNNNNHMEECNVCARMKTTKTTTKAKRPRKKGEPKTPEAAARKKAHQFGQPGGNKPHPLSAATAQRDFYKWVECEATEAELKAYVLDESKPYVRRKFVNAMMNTKKVDDHFALANQVHGAPKQPIEVQDLPKIECKVFGDE